MISKPVVSYEVTIKLNQEDFFNVHEEAQKAGEATPEYIALLLAERISYMKGIRKMEQDGVLVAIKMRT